MQVLIPPPHRSYHLCSFLWICFHRFLCICFHLFFIFLLLFLLFWPQDLRDGKWPIGEGWIRRENRVRISRWKIHSDNSHKQGTPPLFLTTGRDWYVLTPSTNTVKLEVTSVSSALLRPARRGRHTWGAFNMHPHFIRFYFKYFCSYRRKQSSWGPCKRLNCRFKYKNNTG